MVLLVQKGFMHTLLEGDTSQLEVMRVTRHEQVYGLNIVQILDSFPEREESGLDVLVKRNIKSRLGIF